MKRIRTFALSALAVMLMASVAAAETETYIVDTDHSNVGFSVRHMFSNVTGRFNEFSGFIGVNTQAEKITAAKMVINTASVDTRHEKRDKHLQDEDFFNAPKFPTMSFAGMTFKGSGEKIKITGDLTLLGVTKPVTFKAKFLGAGSDPWGNVRAGFFATAVINRKDFGMDFNKVLDTGGLLIGEEVTITLDIEAMKQTAEK